MMEYATDRIPHLGTNDTWDATVSKLLIRRVFMTGIPYDYTDGVLNIITGFI